MNKDLENKFKELNKLLAKAEKLSEKFIKKEDTSFSDTSVDFIDKDMKIYEPKRKISVINIKRRSLKILKNLKNRVCFYAD